MGDKNCITASGRNGNFSGKISWTYKVSRNTVVPGKSVKYSEWGTNVICSPQTGVVTYVVLKASKNKTIPLSQTQFNDMNAGVTNSALPQIIDIFCG